MLTSSRNEVRRHSIAVSSGDLNDRVDSTDAASFPLKFRVRICGLRFAFDQRANSSSSLERRRSEPLPDQDNYDKQTVINYNARIIVFPSQDAGSSHIHRSC